jgi:hypothetical protein
VAFSLWGTPALYSKDKTSAEKERHANRVEGIANFRNGLGVCALQRFLAAGKFGFVCCASFVVFGLGSAWDDRRLLGYFPGEGVSADVESRFEGGFSGFLEFGTIPRRKASGHKIKLTWLFLSPFWCRCGCF